MSEAIALRNRLVQTLEHAEPIDDDEARYSLLTYVFVGAGYAGVEGLAKLQDLAADVLLLYPRCHIHGTGFVLVEARDRLMPAISVGLAEFAETELRGRGIEIRRGTSIERVSADSTEFSTGEVIPTRTVAWTAGVQPHPVVGRLGLPLDDGGRIKVDRYCQVEGSDDVWAIGDAAAVPDPARPGLPSPPTCQHAIRQGRTVGHNVAAALGDGHRRPFKYKTLGVFVDMGRHQAVAETLGIRCAASGVVPRARVPPVADARPAAARPPGHRLDRRAAVRPRLVRARPARSWPTAAWRSAVSAAHHRRTRRHPPRVREVGRDDSLGDVLEPRARNARLSGERAEDLLASGPVASECEPSLEALTSTRAAGTPRGSCSA